MNTLPIPPEILSIMESQPSNSSMIQRIFSLAGEKVLADGTLALSYEQQRAIRQISICHTIESGFNLEVCDTCGCHKLHYNSCGDRNCPICQGLKKEIWVDLRSSEVLDCAITMRYSHAHMNWVRCSWQTKSNYTLCSRDVLARPLWSLHRIRNILGPLLVSSKYFTHGTRIFCIIPTSIMESKYLWQETLKILCFSEFFA